MTRGVSVRKVVGFLLVNTQKRTIGHNLPIQFGSSALQYHAVTAFHQWHLIRRAQVEIPVPLAQHSHARFATKGWCLKAKGASQTKDRCNEG